MSDRPAGAVIGFVSIALALLARPISSQALTYASAGELRDDCAAIPRMLRGEQHALAAAGECIAFIDGWRALADVLRTEQKARPFCIPEAVTTVELAGLFVGAVDAAPARRADRAEVRLYRLLAETFPCPGSGARRDG